ncbi:MAG: family 10 glycosylhydrolase [Stackebrandtia sp.]
MKRRTLAVALGVCGLLATTFAAAPAAYAEDDPPEQWRGYWVDAFNPGVYTPEQVKKVVSEASDLNANALVVQTVRRYDCFCNNALYPRTDAAGLDPEPYDPIAEMIDQAHAAGLEVHAWVNIGTMWNSATPPSSPDHVFNQHGPDAEGEDRWINKRVDGAEFIGDNVHIDPANPGAVDYIVEGVRSVVDAYDVDGINLDYVRYPDYNASEQYNDWGYSETSLARFHAATGRDDVPAPDDAQWSDWRRDQVTKLVRKIYLGMYESDPQARLSIDGITYAYGPQTAGSWEQTRPYSQVLQDWKGWLDEGMIDTVVAMNYKRDWMDDQAQMFAEWTEVLADWQGGRHSVNGTALYLNEIDDSLGQVDHTLTPTDAGNTMAGWAGYSYANASLTAAGSTDPDVKDAERAALAESLAAGPEAPFAEDAAVPEMTWKTEPDVGHVAGTVSLRDGTPLDQADLTLRPLGGGSSESVASDGAGWFGFVDVDPGTYLVVLDLPDGVVGAPVAVVKVKKGQIADASFDNLIEV